MQVLFNDGWNSEWHHFTRTAVQDQFGYFIAFYFHHEYSTFLCISNYMFKNPLLKCLSVLKPVLTFLFSPFNLLLLLNLVGKGDFEIERGWVLDIQFDNITCCVIFRNFVILPKLYFLSLAGMHYTLSKWQHF